MNSGWRSKRGIRQGAARRLAATVWCDVRLQFRNGFYYATGFVTLVYGLVLGQLSGERAAVDLTLLLPVFVLDSMLIGTFYFVAGQVLLEKGEGTLEAQVVSPLAAWEYIASKAITLAGPSVAQYLVLVGIYEGLNFGTVLLVAGVVLASALYVLVGLISVARYNSVSEYLFPSLVYSGVMILPLAANVLGPESGLGMLAYLAYLHPMQGPLELLKAAFSPAAPWQVVYGLGWSGLWLGILGRAALRAFYRFVVARTGAIPV